MNSETTIEQKKTIYAERHMLDNQSASANTSPPSSTIGSPVNPASQKKRKAPFVLMLSIILVICIAVTIFTVHHTYVLVGGLFSSHAIYSRTVTEIDLSGSHIQDFSRLSELKKLEKIDLTNTAFDNLSILHKCSSLREVMIKDQIIPAEDCISLYQAVPGSHVVCRIALDENTVYDSEISTLKLPQAEKSQQRAAASFNRLRRLDLSDCTVSFETLDFLHILLPNCKILSPIEVNGESYLTDAETVSLNGDTTEDDLCKLEFFFNLTTVDVSVDADDTLVQKIAGLYPDYSVNKQFTFLDKTVGTLDELIDLRGQHYTLEDVQAALKANERYLFNLKKIDMCGCGLSNTEMETLCNAYPSIKFVWILHLTHWDVRTDAVIFSSLNGDYFSFEYVYEPIYQYCTDMIALDLGHNQMRNIDKITSLKKLRAAILMDNDLTDLTPLAELKDLEFLEMNMNRFESVEPLSRLEHLKYVNLWSSMGITDLSPLYYHDNLKIAIFHKTIPQDERERFISSNSGCNTFFSVDYDANSTWQILTTNKAWRENEYRKKLKVAFTNWRYVVGFDEESGEFIFDYNTDQYQYL